MAVGFPLEIQRDVFSLFKPVFFVMHLIRGIFIGNFAKKISEFSDFSWNMATGDYGKDSVFSWSCIGDVAVHSVNLI